MFVLTIHRRRRIQQTAFWTFRGLLRDLEKSVEDGGRTIRINHVLTLSKKKAIARNGENPEIFIKRYKGHSSKTQDLVLVNGRAGL